MSGVIKRSTATAAIKINGRKMEMESKGVEGTKMKITIQARGLMKTRLLGELEEAVEEEEIEEEEVEEGDEEEDGIMEVGEVGGIVEEDLLEVAEMVAEMVAEVEVEAALEVEEEVGEEEEVEEVGEEEIEEEEEEEATAEVEDDPAIRFIAFRLFYNTAESYTSHFFVFYLTFDKTILILHDFLAIASRTQTFQCLSAMSHFCRYLIVIDNCTLRERKFLESDLYRTV